MEDVMGEVDDRRRLASEYALMFATLLTVFVVAGVAALTAHRVLGPECSTLAQAASKSIPVSCR